MRLHSPPFEAGLKRLVKATVRASPALKREYRRVRRYRRNTNLAALWRLAVTAVLGYAVWRVQMTTGHLTTTLAAIALYLVAALCFRTQSLGTRLDHSPDNLALILLPVTTATAFRWQFQRFLRESLWLGLDLVAAFGVAAFAGGLPPWKWVCLMACVPWVWFNLMIGAVYGALRLPRWIPGLFCTGMVLAGFILFFGRSAVSPLLLRWLDHSGPDLLVVLPTAWSLAPLGLLDHDSRWMLFSLWLPAVLTIPRLGSWLGGLRDAMAYREFVAPAAADQVPGEEPQAAPSAGRPRQLGPTAIEEIVASGIFFTQPGFRLRNFPEQKLWGWLTPRERALAEFVHPQGLPIWAAWKKLYTVLLAMTLLVLVSGGISHGAQLSVLALGVFVVFCLALARVANHGRAFTPTPDGGVNVPFYAAYGIGLKELAGFFTKHSLIQLPFLLTITVVLGGLSAWVLQMPVPLGLLFGFKVGGLMFGFRFISLVLAVSSGSNDTSRFKFSAILLWVTALLLGLLFFGLAAGALFLPQASLAWLCWGGALVAGWLFFLAYAWFYRFTRFDLMSPPRQ